MRALRGNHIIAGHRGGVCACWRRAGVAAAALALPLAASGIAAAPALAAGGYKVTRTVPVGPGPSGVAVDPAARTAYMTSDNDSGDLVAAVPAETEENIASPGDARQDSAVTPDDSGAGGAAVGSPGITSGDVIQVPINVPVNLCGDTIDVIGVLNPASANTCVNS